MVIASPRQRLLAALIDAGAVMGGFVAVVAGGIAGIAAYPTDQQARQKATAALYKANEITPFKGCGRQVLGAVLFRVVLGLGTRGGRTVYDRVTGTVVIAEP